MIKNSPIALSKKIFENDIISSLSIMGLRGGMLAGKFLLSLFIARFMGLESLGIYGLIVGASAVLPVVMRFGVFTSVSRDIINQPLDQLTHHLRHYTMGCAIAYLFLLGIFLLVGWYFDVMFLSMLTFFIIVLEHAAYDIFILINNIQRPKLANILYSLQSALWIYVFIVLAFLLPSLRNLEMVLSFWIGGGVIALTITALITRHWPWKAAFAAPWDKTWYMPYLQKSWRLYVSEIISVCTLYIDRYLITLFLSLELVGIYVLFWQVSSAICNLIGAGVMFVHRARLILANEQKDDAKFRAEHKACLKKTLGGAGMLSVVSAGVVPFLVQFSNQPLAMDYLPLLWLMLVSIFFRLTIDVTKITFFAKRQDKALLHMNIAALTLNTVMAALLLYAIGVYAVPLTVILVNAALLGRYNMRYLRKLSA